MTTATGQMIAYAGQSATWTPAGGEASSITCLFDNEYQDIDIGSGEVGSSGPAAHCETSYVSTAKKGDAFATGGVNYTVVKPKPDGTGMTTLMLRKA